MTTPVSPAVTYTQAVELTIFDSNQFHEIVNGDAATTVTTASGDVDTVRKALTDNFYFKSPILWSNGTTNTVFNQIYTYTDGTLWFSPFATSTNPITLTSFGPYNDTNWKLFTGGKAVSSAGGRYIQAVAPTEAVVGDSWYNTTDGRTYVKFNDGTSVQWVEESPQSASEEGAFVGLRVQLARLAAEAGYNLVSGSFEEGGTLTSEADVLWYQADGKYYSWGGSFNKVVPINAAPSSSGGVGAGAWVNKLQETLKSQLASLDSTVSISGAIANILVKNATRPRTFYDHGAYGDGIADDTTAVLAAIAFVKANRGYRLEQVGGKFKYSVTLPFNDCNNVLSSTDEPQHFSMQCEMIYAGTDKAVNQTGNGWGYSVYIETLTGSGVTTEGVAGGSSENIGLYIGPNSCTKTRIGTITGFNHDILFDGAYFNTVDVGYVYRCLYSATFRKHPTLGYLANRNTLNADLLGGPYLDSGDVDFATKRLNNAKVGLLMSGSSANIIHAGGIEYCVRTDDGYAIDLASDAVNNEITAHSEGGLQHTVRDLGTGNRLDIDGVNSQSITGNAVNALGISGSYGPISKQGTATQVTSFAPHQGQGDVRINPSKEITGSTFIRDVMNSAATKYNYVSSAPGVGAFNRSDTVNTAVSAGSNYPPEINAYGGEQTYILTTATDNTTWFTVGPYSLSGVTEDDMMFSSFIRGAVNNLKCSVFILDQSLSFVDSINMELRSNTPWKTIKFPFKRGSATSLYYRIALRGFEGAGGGTIEFCRPCITFNIASELYSKVLVGEPNKRHILGNVTTEPIIKKYADKERIGSGAIVSTAFQINGLRYHKFTDTSGGLTINSFTNTTINQLFTLLNVSGSTLTVSPSATALASTLTIATGFSMTFIVDDAGAVYPLR